MQPSTRHGRYVASGLLQQSVEAISIDGLFIAWDYSVCEPTEYQPTSVNIYITDVWKIINYYPQGIGKDKWVGGRMSGVGCQHFWDGGEGNGKGVGGRMGGVG